MRNPTKIVTNTCTQTVRKRFRKQICVESYKEISARKRQGATLYQLNMVAFLVQSPDPIVKKS